MAQSTSASCRTAAVTAAARACDLSGAAAAAASRQPPALTAPRRRRMGRPPAWPFAAAEDDELSKDMGPSPMCVEVSMSSEAGPTPMPQAPPYVAATHTHTRARRRQPATFVKRSAHAGLPQFHKFRDKLGRIRRGFCRNRPKSVQIAPTLAVVGQTWVNADPILAEFGTSVVEHGHSVWPSSAKVRRNRPCWSTPAKAEQLPNLGRRRQQFGRNRLKLAVFGPKCGRIHAELGPLRIKSAMLGHTHALQ